MADEAPEDAPPPAEGAPAEQKREVAEDEYVNPHKLLLFKYWRRPLFLQYRYLHDYRYSYYDELLDYIDKRRRGYYRETPHPETWAERALRTYNSYDNKVESFRILVEDAQLVTRTKLSGAFQLLHAKNYFNRRFSSFFI